jgi:hypothetical protein
VPAGCFTVPPGKQCCQLSNALIVVIAHANEPLT